MEKIFKHKLQKVMEFANIILPQLKRIDEKGDIDYIRCVVQYIFEAKEIKEKDELLNVLVKNLSKPAGDNVMTIAQQLRQEGRYEGSVSFVKYLLSEGKSIKEIGELTGLSFSEIEKIKKEIK
jgi:hypothetical protein